MEKGRALPDWYLAEPPSHPTDAWYFTAFWELSSTRTFEHGPIPWNIIREYGCSVGLDDVMLKVFEAVIRHVDGVYLKWVSDELARQRKSSQSTAKAKSKGSKTRAPKPRKRA